MNIREEYAFNYINRFRRSLKFYEVWPRVFSQFQTNEPIIEVRGPSTKGVPIVANEILARTILPFTNNIGGQNRRVLYINTANLNNLEALQLQCEEMVKTRISDMTKVVGFAGDSMVNVTVMSAADWCRKYPVVCKINAFMSANRELSLMFIDDIDKFDMPKVYAQRRIPYLNKLLYLRASFLDYGIPIVYIKNDRSADLPPAETFDDVTVVLIVEDHPPKGFKLTYCERESKRITIIKDANDLHR